MADNNATSNHLVQEKIRELTQAKEFIELYVSVINHDIFAPIKFINIIGDNLNPKLLQIRIVGEFPADH